MIKNVAAELGTAPDPFGHPLFESGSDLIRSPQPLEEEVRFERTEVFRPRRFSRPLT